MADTVYRLLGPNHNRLVTVIDTEKHTPGQIGSATAELLRKAGWHPYAGSAKTDKGWVVPDSDPMLHPRPLKTR